MLRRVYCNHETSKGDDADHVSGGIPKEQKVIPTILTALENFSI